MSETDFTIHHVGVAVADMAKAMPFYQQVFGFVVISGPIADPIQKMTVAFVGRGVKDPCPIEFDHAARKRVASQSLSGQKPLGVSSLLPGLLTRKYSGRWTRQWLPVDQQTRPCGGI